MDAVTTTAPPPAPAAAARATEAPDPVTAMFASRTVTEHLLRGLLGLALAVVALWQAGSHPAALLLLLPAVLAWRGCPTCWALGLGATCRRR